MSKNYNKIYKVELLMINNNSDGYYDTSDIENIADIFALSPVKVIKEILVYKHFSKFKEIITDLEIPGLESYSDYSNYISSITQNKPYCFRYCKKENHGKYHNRYTLLDNLLARPEELESYLSENLQVDDSSLNQFDPKEMYKSNLESLFKIAEEEFFKYTKRRNIYTNDMKKIDEVKRKIIIKKYDLSRNS